MLYYKQSLTVKNGYYEKPNKKNIYTYKQTKRLINQRSNIGNYNSIAELKKKYKLTLLFGTETERETERFVSLFPLLFIFFFFFINNIKKLNY